MICILGRCLRLIFELEAKIVQYRYFTNYTGSKNSGVGQSYLNVLRQKLF